MNTTNLRINLAATVKKFGGAKNKFLSGMTILGSTFAKVHFISDTNNSTHMSVSIHQVGDDIPSEYEYMFVDKENTERFIALGHYGNLVQAQDRGGNERVFNEYHCTAPDNRIDMTLDIGHIEMVKAFAKELHEYSYHAFIKSASFVNLDGKVYLAIASGHVLGARYVCDAEGFDPKLFNVAIPIEFFEFIAKAIGTKEKEYNVSFHFNSDNEGARHFIELDNGEVRITSRLGVEILPTAAVDLLRDKAVSYNGLPVAHMLTWVKGVNFVGTEKVNNRIKFTLCANRIDLNTALDHAMYEVTPNQYHNDADIWLNGNYLKNALSVFKKVKADKFNLAIDRYTSNTVRVSDEENKTIGVIAKIAMDN